MQLRWLALVVLALWASANMQGCLPPDWSFCDCDFRDNFWNTVISDIHELWDEGSMQKKARDNSTFQGKYFQTIPEGYECPEQPTVFWKAWPKMGMTRGLIEGSMGDLWMPAARDRIKQMCMAGHFSLCVICAHHYLVRAARAIEAGETNYMRWMEAAYGHMVSIRNLAGAYQLRNCMGQQGFGVDPWGIHGWTVKWIGPENQGTQPMAAYYGGQVDPYQMMYDKPMPFTEKSRKGALPDRQPCVPYKNPKCWRRASKLLVDTCEHCCSPFIHKSGRGDPWCFDAEWTFERCCQTDFQDLICELKRSGEEGGCVDCKKSVSYVCLTPPEKNLHDAQDNYNKNVDKYNDLQKQSTQLAKNIIEFRNDLIAKDIVYREKHTEFNHRLGIWHEAFHNYSRLVSADRFVQQQLVHNTSSRNLASADNALFLAREALKNATETLKIARENETQAQVILDSNISTHNASVNATLEARRRFAEARVAQRVAGENVFAADDAASREMAAEAEAFNDSVLLNRTREDAHVDTEDELDEALVDEREADLDERDASLVDATAVSAVQMCRSVSSSAQSALAVAASDLAKAQGRELATNNTLEAAIRDLDDATQSLQQRKDELASVTSHDGIVRNALITKAGATGQTAMQCLMSKTPANRSSRPPMKHPGADDAMDNESCSDGAVIEDENDFCVTWAKQGECEQNPTYMRRSCPKSCAVAPILPSCANRPAPVQPVLPADQRFAIIAELLAMVASVPVGLYVSGDGMGSDVDAVKWGLRAEVQAAVQAVKAAHERGETAKRNLATMELAVAASERSHEQAQRNEVIAEEERNAAKSGVLVAEKEVHIWQGLVRGNETIVANSKSALATRRDELRRLQVATDQAIALEQGLEKARGLAEDAAVQARDSVSRASRRLKVLQEHIETLNASISENLTTVVSTWLETKDESARQVPDASWGSRILKAAKNALVKMVNSIETFLESYVMSISDKETVVELVRAMEDQRGAIQKLSEAEVGAKAATAQADDALRSLEKAATSRKRAEASVERAAGIVSEAEEVLRLAEVGLEQTKNGLTAREEVLDKARALLVAREEALERAKAAVIAAAAAIVAAKQNLKSAQEAVQIGQAEVMEASFAFTAAEGSSSTAEARAWDGYLERLQQECTASEPEFVAYLQERELLSLLNAVVAQAKEAHETAVSRHANTVANHGGAVTVYYASRDALLDARQRNHVVAEEATFADSELVLKEAAQNVTAARAAAARDTLHHRRELVEQVSAIRRQAEAAAAAATASYLAAIAKVHEAHELCVARREELRAALATTRRRAEEVERAEADQAHALEEWEAAKIWFADFVASLQLELKEQIVDQATSKEDRLHRHQVKTANREQKMRTLLGTHERHLKLLNTQVELDAKEAARIFAKTEFDAAQKAVTDAQEKLDKTQAEEEKCHENIGSTYKFLGELMEIHEKATEVHGKQDPEDRKRSFSTKLEGSGPDPNGIDVR